MFHGHQRCALDPFRIFEEMDVSEQGFMDWATSALTTLKRKRQEDQLPSKRRKTEKTEVIDLTGDSESEGSEYDADYDEEDDKESSAVPHWEDDDTEYEEALMDGSLYMVGDKDWPADKFKVGMCQYVSEENVRKYLMTRYGTTFGKRNGVSNVVIYKIVQVQENRRKSESEMLKRLGIGREKGEVVYGDMMKVMAQVKE